MSVSRKVLEDAEREFEEELHREKVERHKEKLRLRKSIWVRLFPWRIKITIERRDEPKYAKQLENFSARTSPQHVFTRQCPCANCVRSQTGGK